MKKLTKLFVSMLLVLSLVFSLTACGAPAETGTESGNNGQTSATDNQQTTQTTQTTKTAKSNFTVPAEGYDGKDVTITFYHTMGSNLTDVLNVYIEEFNKLYPNIHIVHEQVGSYTDVKNQIATQITFGEQPNIAYCYPDHVALFNKAKAVATLDDLIDSKIEVTRADGTKETIGYTQEQLDDFVPGYYNEGKQFGDGLMYCLPFLKSTEVLYYNKTYFEANGLSVPTTWDEMKALCKKLRELDPNCIPLGYDSAENWFITMTQQYGTPYTSASGDHYLFNTAENRAFVKEFREWYQNHYVTTQNLNGAYTSALFVSTDTVRSYMSIGSSAGATHQRPTANADGTYPFEVGITSIPQVDPSNPKVISQGPSVCIFKKDNPQEVVASFLFLKFLTTSVEFQAEFSIASGYVPVLKSVMNNEVYKKFLDGADGGKNIAALSVKTCVAETDKYFTSAVFNGSATARTQVGLAFEKAMSDTGKDVDKLIKDAFQNALDECEYGG